LTTKGVDYRTINYLEEPLSADALKQLLRSAGLRPQDALRKNEEEVLQPLGQRSRHYPGVMPAHSFVASQLS